MNPASGQRRARRVLAAAQAHFQAPEWALGAHVLSKAGEAFRLAARCARRGDYAVLLAGGDGTINEAAAALAGSRTALGVIPAGTGNGFARALSLPLNPEAACRALSRSRPRRLDIGSIAGGGVFVSTCGVGLDAWAARRANAMRWINRVSGFLRYLGASLLSALEFRPCLLRVTVDGKAYVGPCLLVVVSNGDQYGFGVSVNPGAKLDDGLLDVSIIPPMPPGLLLANCRRAYFSLPLKGVRRLAGKRVSVQALDGREIPFHVDGEPAGTIPLKAAVRPKALKVLIPF